ncbi:mitogen-activated protein kinase kinase kinase SSK1 Ecym_5077 [Eremothecium cymbalariae DBVPG|uniref:Response regulatory domain-containing protein n=1 Tax=Eremothecium cymbalariae (strain CBS 270.75 / DBVPG 7215 / KCTC 17166 / NRRL Y-17582) TaxID=931890 RepID=I6NCS5_ERECY|nr:hypothetical protein Ecym_5077 [Eremothecium cymbalariae DBVPG\
MGDKYSIMRIQSPITPDSSLRTSNGYSESLGGFRKVWLKLDDFSDVPIVEEKQSEGYSQFYVSQPVAINFSEDDTIDDIKQKFLRKFGGSRWAREQNNACVSIGFYCGCGYSAVSMSNACLTKESPPVSLSGELVAPKATRITPLVGSNENMGFIPSSIDSFPIYEPDALRLKSSSYSPRSKCMPSSREGSLSPLNLSHIVKNVNSYNPLESCLIGQHFPHKLSPQYSSDFSPQHNRNFHKLVNNSVSFNQQIINGSLKQHHSNISSSTPRKNKQLRSPHKVFFESEELVSSILETYFGGIQRSEDALVVIFDDAYSPVSSRPPVTPLIGQNDSFIQGGATVGTSSHITQGDDQHQSDINISLEDMEKNTSFPDLNNDFRSRQIMPISPQQKGFKLITDIEQLQSLSHSFDDNYTGLRQAILLLPKNFQGELTLQVNDKGLKKHIYRSPKSSPARHVEYKPIGPISIPELETNRKHMPLTVPRIEPDAESIKPHMSMPMHPSSPVSFVEQESHIKPCDQMGYLHADTDGSPNYRPSPIKRTRDKVFPKINVLIVEDNIINQAILVSFLKRHRISYEIAKNGAEAVEKWRQGGIHLILMDLQLPLLSGLEATKQIRDMEKLNGINKFHKSDLKPGRDTSLDLDRSKFRSPVIIVALTAFSSHADRREALVAGCNDYLTKPVNLDWLSSKITEWGCMQALIDFDGWTKGERRMTDNVLLKPQISSRVSHSSVTGSNKSNNANSTTSPRSGTATGTPGTPVGNSQTTLIPSSSNSINKVINLSDSHILTAEPKDNNVM